MTVIDVGALLAEELTAHQAGRLADAEACYRRALKANPEQPDALHLLAVATFQNGRAEEARTLARRATTHAPAQPTFWNTLGVAAQAASDLDEAARCFARIVQLNPEYPDGWANLAGVAALRGDHSTEASALERVTALRPDQAHTWGRRGILAYLAGQIELARDCFTKTTRLAPSDPDAWSNLGATQLCLGSLEEAEASQPRAVALRPDFIAAQNNLGNVLVARSRWVEAAAILEPVVQRAPNDPNGWVNLGHALKGLERFGEARTAYERALQLSPQISVAWMGLGDTLQAAEDFTSAIQHYEKALSLNPDDPDTTEHLGIALQRLGRLDEALAAFSRSLTIDPANARVSSARILTLDLQEGAEAEAALARQEWNARFGRRTVDAPVSHRNSPDQDRPLRVGYVSADFRHHSAAYTILPVLRGHDHAQVTVACYSGVTAPDHVTEQIRPLADIWHDVAYWSDDDLEAQIRADEIDVLVDLSSHSGGGRLPVLAREAAPVQVTAWGYAASTGLDTMHYFLADPIVVPPSAHASYSEEVVSLPSVICYEPPPYTPPVSALPASERGFVTFGSFNRLPKITNESLAAWARVLDAMPAARLVVKCPGVDSVPTREHLFARMAARGIDVERVSLLGGTPHPDHLAAHAQIDVMLDTFPHSGGITTLDAFLMGVPVVTLLGQRVPGRLSASFLTTLGLPDLVAQTPEQYVAIATGLAQNVERLTYERATLRERLLASPLANAPFYTAAVEAAYREMWRRWCTTCLTRNTEETP